MIPNNDNINIHYSTCDCYSPEHILRFMYFGDEDLYDPDLPYIDVDVYLDNWIPWYKRIWIGIKYMFGKTHKHGNYGSVMLNPEEVEKLRDYLSDFLENHPALKEEK